MDEHLVWLEKIEEAKREVEALPYVKGEVCFVNSNASANNNKVKATLWCCWDSNRRSFKQECVACDERSRPTQLEALRVLHAKLVEKHGKDDHVADERAVRRRHVLQEPESPSSELPKYDRNAILNARNALLQLSAMQHFKTQRATAERIVREAGKREHAANMALHSAKQELEKAVAQRTAAKASLAEAAELMDYKFEKPGKKARITQAVEHTANCATGSQPANAATASQPTNSSARASGMLGIDGSYVRRGDHTGRPCSSESESSDNAMDEIPNYFEWDAKKWKECESRAQARRSVQMNRAFDDDKSVPRRGSRRGWRNHWRYGLIGAVQYWACGRRFRVVHLLAELATHFGVQAEVGARLGFTLSKEEVEQLKVDTYLIDRVVQALSQLKQCRTEAEREDYHIVLAALAPKREAERSREGMLRAASQRLRVERGVRYFNGEKRPYAFDQAVARRAVFDEAVFKCSDALKPGDEGISHGQLCTVVEIDHKEDTCALRFSQGGVEAVREYTCIYRGSNPRKQAPFPQGSARLRRAPPSLRVQVRERRCDEKMEAARAKVEELFDAEGARSPSQRDSVRRRVGVGLYENTQALIVFAKYSALYTLY